MVRLTLLGQDPPSELETRILLTAQSGGGVLRRDVPYPLLQRARTFECQTMALINGVRAIGGQQYFAGRDRDVYRFVDAIRQKAKETPGYNPDSMDSIAYFFPEFGIPLKKWSNIRENSIETTQCLFQERRFLGCSNDKLKHVTTLVPLSSPTCDHFVMELDSLTGDRTLLSLREYTDRMQKINPFLDNYIVYYLEPASR